jgi:hypothetical protein
MAVTASNLWGFLSAPSLSPFLFVNLFFGFLNGVNRAAAMTHKFLSFFDDSFGGLAQFLSSVVTQNRPTVEADETLTAARSLLGSHAMSNVFWA